MTMQDMLNTIEANAGQGAQSTNDLFQYHQMIEAKADQAVCQDLTSISSLLRELQECKGACQLQWRPTR